MEQARIEITVEIDTDIWDEKIRNGATQAELEKQLVREIILSPDRSLALDLDSALSRVIRFEYTPSIRTELISRKE